MINAWYLNRVGLGSVGDGDSFLRQHRQTSSRVTKRKTKTPPTLLNTMATRAEFLEVGGGGVVDVLGRDVIHLPIE